MPGYTLLTGATGLVGRFLTWDLLERGHRLAVLIRPTQKLDVYQRLESILQMRERETGRSLPRPVCLEGDVVSGNLGLKPSDAKWVAANCSRFLHNAAVLTFYGSSRDEDPWKTNVGGTRNVLQACEDWGIRDFHYVSTAYVSGTRQGRILEDELDCGQDFRNDYEDSKFQAETLVRKAKCFDQLTVYRPAVIAGDSRTGYTNTYHGVYAYLKLMSILVWNVEPDEDGRRYTPVRLNMYGNERRNIVPADWVSEAICRLLERPEAHGGTYHLAPEHPITPSEIIEAGYKHFNSYGVEFCGPTGEEADDLGDMDRNAHDNMTMYQPYETTDPTFDLSNLQRVLPDLPCPRLDEAMLHRFWRYGEEDRWGKRRQPEPELNGSLRGQLKQCLNGRFETNREASAGNGKSSDTVLLNLDICGPGGGQWRVSIQQGRPSSVTPGLCDEAQATLRMTYSQWNQILDQNRTDGQRGLCECLQVHAPSVTETELADSVCGALLSLRQEAVPHMA